MSRRSLPLTSFAALLLVASSSAQIFSLSEPKEVELGRRGAMEIEFDLPMVQDPLVVDYVERLGLRLVRQSGRTSLGYRFRIIQSDDVNAFVLPGGFVYITRGLMEATETEAELAGVLAHEISHVVARHHASKIRQEQLASLGFSILAPAVAGGMNALAIREGGKTGVQGLFRRFTREDEREADRLGAKNLLDAGYDPRAMVSFFERLAEMREGKPGVVKRFFSTHPSPEDRVDNVNDLVATFELKEDLTADTETFRAVRERLAAIRAESAGSTSLEAVSAILESLEEAPESIESRHREVSALFAPLIYQALGNQPRYDYITSFDFDNDWRGNNNWANAEDLQFPLNAWIYSNVRETRTHYFLHYAAFHPRDYKGGKRGGKLFSKMIRGGVSKLGSNDPTGRAQELVLAHENDLEGALIVVEKQGDDPAAGRIVFVETLAHNQFLKYLPAGSAREGFGEFQQAGRRVKLYVEPRGHGILAFSGDESQIKSAVSGFRLYTFTGYPEEQTDENEHKDTIGYDLIPISTTLWPRSREGATETYGATQDFGTVLIDLLADDGSIEERTVRLGRLGSAFSGKVGGANLARPPWAWFDGKNRNEAPGAWYFDPARVIREHYGLGEEFSSAYLEWPDLDVPTPALSEAAVKTLNRTPDVSPGPVP